MDKRNFFKCGDQTFHVVKSNEKNAYSVKIYDYKSHMWCSADIYGKTVKECKDITKYVYDAIADENINVTIDYGNCLSLES